MRMKVTNFMLQEVEAQLRALQLVKELQEMEEAGIVQHIHGEEWKVLDLARYMETMKFNAKTRSSK